MDEQILKFATELTDILLKREPIKELNFFIADIENNIERFQTQIKLLSKSDERFPCILWASGDPIPVDMGSSFLLEDIFIERWPFPFIKEILHYALSSFDMQNKYTLRLFPIHEVRQIFRSRLISFLYSRTLKNWDRQPPPPYDPSNGPGFLPFRVITQRQGLRVHYSPAYFFNPNQVFGSPTSPVHGWIRPGRYVFGATGINLPLRFEQAEFDIPPCHEANLVTI